MNIVDSLIIEVSNRRKFIVVVGDVIIDRWVHGRVAECQDGCPKFIRGSVHESAGGAANAYNCLTHWHGVHARLCGGVNQPTKHRFVENGTIVWRYDDEVHNTLGHKAALDTAMENVNRADAVLLSDYDKGLLTPSFIKEVATVCNERRVPCVADVKSQPDVYMGCIVKCNTDWARRHYNGNLVRGVLTREYLRPRVNGNVVGPDLPHVRCVNHVGAGDCFSAHLTLALAYGFSTEQAAAIAHSAGRVYVQRAHNFPPHPQEISDDFEGFVVG